MFFVLGLAPLQAISVENNSDCLIAFVTVVKMEFKEDGSLKEMNLYWAEWLEPWQRGVVYMREGEHYGTLIEAWIYNPDTRLPERKVGDTYKEGKFDPNRGTNKIDIRCKHTRSRQDL